jgi:tRNA(Ile)-lysidine synthase
LSWRDDRSNADPRYTRNRVRSQLVPALEKDFNPRLLRVIGDLAEAQRRDAEWLDVLVREESSRLVEPEGPGRLRIRAAGWVERPEALSRRLVRWMLLELGAGRDLRRVHLMRALAFLRTGRTGTAIELPGGMRLSRENDDSFVLARASHL